MKESKKNSSKLSPNASKTLTQRIKVCGMREEANIFDLINQTEFQFMGLIFYQKSKRYVNKKLNLSCLDLIKKNTSIQLVGVFVEQSIKEILEIAEQYQLDILQLHGGNKHSIEFCKELKKTAKAKRKDNGKNKKYKIIKTIRVAKIKENNESSIKNQTSSFIKALENSYPFKNYDPCIDYFMFDTHNNQYGGLGKSFDWSAIPSEIPIPYFLSGGLSLSNVVDIKKFIKRRKQNNESVPYALDLNSCFEIEPALKDVQKIKEFIKIINLK